MSCKGVRPHGLTPWALTQVTLVMSIACGVSQTSVPSATASVPVTSANSSVCASSVSQAAVPWFGILQTSGRYLTEELHAGLAVLSLELAWDRYEPRQGEYDMAYVSEQQRKLQSFCRAGFSVILSAGIHYAPAWVFRVSPHAHYVNQYGDRYQPSQSQDRVPNGVFDPAVRQAQAAYVARIRTDFCDCFYAVRVGGGQGGEVTYPPGEYNHHVNSYWVYDRNAQANTPVPGWVPGHLSVERARQFWTYYIGKLLGYQNWLIATYRRHFSGWLQVLYPGWGLRAGQADLATSHLLSGKTAAEETGLTNVATELTVLVNGITDMHVMAYSTAMEELDRGSTPLTQSPMRHIHELASARGIAAAGENSRTGQSVEVMRDCVRRVRTMPLMGMMWLAEPDLISAKPPAATLANYGSLIGAGMAP
jgi:hypothetical protein